LVEKFWKDKFIAKLNDGLFATMDYALQECALPDVKETKSALAASVLRFGDPEANPEQSVLINIRTSKATAKAVPPPMKRFSRSTEAPINDSMEWAGENGAQPIQYAPVKSRTDHFLREDEPAAPEGSSSEPKGIENGTGVKVEVDDDGEVIVRNTEADPETGPTLHPVDEENLQLAYKYGSSYVPVDKTEFEQLKTEKGMDILGFIPAKKVGITSSWRSLMNFDTQFRRDWAMGEVYYVWGDTESGRAQIAFSSLVQAMLQEDLYAVIRMVTGSNYAPKLGVAVPRMLDKVDCLLWVQVMRYFSHQSRQSYQYSRCLSPRITETTRSSHWISSTIRRV
jgi:ATP-dependent DNA helicase 2 subunit 2